MAVGGESDEVGTAGETTRQGSWEAGGPWRRVAAVRARRVVVVLAVLVGTVLAACAVGDGDGDARDADRDLRIAAVRELRAALGPPATEVGSAAATLGDVLDELFAELPEEPDARASAADAVRDRDVAGLLASADELAEVDVEAAGGDAGAVADLVAAAATARDDVVAAARSAAELAEEELAQVDRAAEADRDLAAVPELWREPGSRSQTLERLATARATAEELATELAGEVADVGPVPACSDMIARRAEAAAALVEGSEELADLVSARRGEEFGTRLDELLADPFGTGGRTLVAEDRSELDCHVLEGAAAAVGGVAAALTELEAALNPPDLA